MCINQVELFYAGILQEIWPIYKPEVTHKIVQCMIRQTQYLLKIYCSCSFILFSINIFVTNCI